jgi:hypothetical protein
MFNCRRELKIYSILSFFLFVDNCVFKRILLSTSYVAEAEKYFNQLDH